MNYVKALLVAFLAMTLMAVVTRHGKNQILARILIVLIYLTSALSVELGELIGQDGR